MAVTKHSRPRGGWTGDTATAATTAPSAPPAAVPAQHRFIPRSILGLTAMILAFSIGAALSGVVLYAYYAYRLNQTENRVQHFISGFGNTVSQAQNTIKSQQAAAKTDIQKELSPLEKLAAAGNTTQAILSKAVPSLYFVHTLDPNGAPSVGTAFAVASDSQETLLLTSYNTVQAAARQPGPDVFVRHNDTDTKVKVYAWDQLHDLALIVLTQGSLPKLAFASQSPAIGDRVFALSGLGSSGGAISQGFVSDVSSAGIQHNAPISAAFQGGPLLDSDGQVVGILSQTYFPLGFAAGGVWFAVPPKAACEKVLSCPNNTPASAGSTSG